jgi:hypothetical protein
MRPVPSKSPARSSGRKTLRFTTALAIVLGVAATALAVVLAYRLNLTWEAPVVKVLQVSDRTRGILAETQGSLRVICFMDRRHPMFRPVSRLLRGLCEASRRVAGAEIGIEYVDPHWDLTRAGQLASANVPENAVVFERQRRRVVVTLDDMLTQRSAFRAQEDSPLRPSSPAGGGTGQNIGVFRGEGVCAAAIARLSLPFDRSLIYWMEGHGEPRFDDYDQLRGFSDIAREITRGGFGIKALSLPGRTAIPDDCHVLMIVGATRPFVREELAMLEKYLQRGGRLLCLLTPRATTGLEGLLERWGVHVTSDVAVSPRTLTGQELFCTVFSDHLVTRDLARASVIFGQPACIEAVQSAAVAAPDRPQVTLLAMTDEAGWGESAPDAFPRVFDAKTDLKGPVAMAAAVEWGGNVAKDVTFKPTRICVVGEADFVMNGALAARASANRDFLLNAVSWLAGVEAGTAPSLGGDATLYTGLTRRGWVILTGVSAFGLPLGLLLLFCVVSRFGGR